MANAVRLHVITRSYLEDAYAAVYDEAIEVDDHEIGLFETAAAYKLAGRDVEVVFIEDEELRAYSTPSQEEWSSDERIIDREALNDALAMWLESVHDRRQ